MPDHRFHSLHLEGQPRLGAFRAARAAVERACGSQTLAGEPLVDDNDLRADTILADHAPPVNPLAHQFAAYLKDGTNVYPLHIGMNSVGRLPDNDVIIRDECVSRRHCAIVVHSNFACELHDVASKNGTLLNGKKIPAPARLQAGDQITLCNRRLTFHIVEAQSEPTPVAG
jgi:hypothetical protein